MFERPGRPELAGELQEELASYTSQVMLVDRVWLAPAWRGHGVGRLLGWVCPDPMVAALMPSPIALDEEQQEDEAAFNQEMAKARRTWKSVGSRPFGKDIMVMDPAMVHHGVAVDKLARKARPAAVTRQPPQVPALGWRARLFRSCSPVSNPGAVCRDR